MDDRQVGVLAGLIGGGGLGVQLLTPRLLEVPSQVPAWLPSFGSLSQTWVLYRYALDIVGPAVPLLLAVALGLHVGKHRDLTSGYRRLLVAVSTGSFAGVAVCWAVVMVSPGGSVPLGDATGWAILLGTFVRWFVEVSLVVIVGAFAGAALAHFRSDETDPAQPVATPDEGDAPATERTGGQSSRSRRIAFE